MAEDSSVVETACARLKESFKKQAAQERGEEPVTPYLDTLSADGSFDGSNVKELTDELFNTESLNQAWQEAYDASSDPEKGSQDGKEIRSRAGVAYFCAWKKALLKFYEGNDDIQAVYGLGMCFINIGAQSVEATRLSLAEPPSSEETKK